MNPEDRLRRIDNPERWDLPIQKRTDAFPPRRRPSPLVISLATIAAVAVVGIVVFSGFGTGIRSVRHPAPPIAASAMRSPTPTPTSTVVPWVDSPSDGLTTDAATADLVPTYKPSDVTITGHPGGVEMADWRVWISLKNTGDSTCAIAATGTRVSAGDESEVMSEKWGGFAKIVPPGSAMRIVAEFSGACAASPMGAEEVPVASTPTIPVDFVVPGVGHHEIPAAIDRNFLYCGVNQEVEWLPKDDPDPASPATDLVASIDGPPIDETLIHPLIEMHAKATDATIDYTVTLTNTGEQPYDFGSYCPTYVQAVSIGDDSGTPEPPGGYPKSASAQSLPCAGLPPILPGDSETFAMQLPMPEHAVGAGPLVWSMTDGPSVDYVVELRF